MLAGLTLQESRVTSLAGESQALATDLADYLVGKGIPFREAHGAVRQLCQFAELEGKKLSDLDLSEYRRFSPQFDEGVFDITAESAAAARNIPGGTAPIRVAEALAQAKKLLEDEADGL